MAFSMVKNVHGSLNQGSPTSKLQAVLRPSSLHLSNLSMSFSGIMRIAKISFILMDFGWNFGAEMLLYALMLNRGFLLLTQRKEGHWQL